MNPLTIADIAHENDEVAFTAYTELVGPALWMRIVRGVHRAKPGTCACRPERPPMFDIADEILGPLCGRCTDLWTDRLMSGYQVVREALAGQVPTITGGPNAGQEIREWIVIRDHFASAEAERQDVPVFGAVLRDFAPRERTPPHLDWLRAVWAQLVHYPTSKRIIPTVRRESAAERGLPTRPEVAICSAEWAAPLRVDPADRDILIEFLLGVRDEITDPFSLPDMQLKFGLTAGEVDERLQRSLALLRRYNRDFYERAVAVPLAGSHGATDPDGHGCAGEHVPSVEDACVAEVDARVARSALIAELAFNPGRGRAHGVGSGVGVGPNLVMVRLLQVIIDAGDGRRVDIVALFRRHLRLDEERARAEVARFVGLVVGAGVRWVDVLLRAVDGRAA